MFELVNTVMVHESVEHLKGWVRTTWHPYLHKIPIDLHEVFVEKLKSLFSFNWPTFMLLLVIRIYVNETG